MWISDSISQSPHPHPPTKTTHLCTQTTPTYLVEEDDGVGPAADGVRELPALLEPDVAGRRADELGNGVLLFG